MENVLAILLAGGAGERLYPLTRDTAKPAVPFGGPYRIIDFTLSNCINSDARRILILTQYKSLELIRHIRDGWRILSPELGEYIEVIPPMKRVHEDWYQGTADAVFQNFQSIEAEDPEFTLILSGDHIYKMDYGEMLAWHREHGADITIATIQVPPAEAGRYGVVEIAEDYRVTGFEEKPQHDHPAPSRFDPSMVSASMGIYIFNTGVLLRALHEDSKDPDFDARFRPGRDPPQFGVLPRDCVRFSRSQRQAGALLAGRGDARRLLRGQHGPGVGDSRIQSLRPALAHSHQGHAAAARPNSFSPRRAAAWALRSIPS